MIKWEEIASAARSNGAGGHYHNVKITAFAGDSELRASDLRAGVSAGDAEPQNYRVVIQETWGSDQGSHNEEHGRREVGGHGKFWGDALSAAERRAREVGISVEYLVQAVSDVESALVDLP